MSKTSQLFVYLLLTVIVTLVKDSCCKVYSRKQNVDPYKTIKLDERVGVRSVLRRFRRDTPPTSDSKPTSKENQLGNKDEGFNEAIVHWSGDNSSTIFVLTRQHYPNGTVPKSRVYMSTNYGDTFSTKSFPDSNAVINYFYTSPMNKNKLVFTDAARKLLYVTRDEGKTLVGEKLSFSPDKLLFHPTKDEWLLGYSFDEEKLHVSNDLGESWSEVAAHVNTRFFWAVPGVDENMDVIHIETEDLDHGGYMYKALSVDERKMTDLSTYPQITGIDAGSLLVQDDYIFVQKTTPFDSHLYVSYRKGEFKKAFFPMEAHPQDYSIVSTDQQQVFIAADHNELLIHLYLSDPTGVFYVQSLSNLVALMSYRGFDADLYEVRGMNGTYIANQRMGDVKRTYITFDEGGEWNLIPAPKIVANKTIKCELPKCSLYLHLSVGATMEGIPYILSEDNAPGLIMAQGFIDRANVEPPAKSTLFISSDGGRTWKASMEGEYSHNILDQGGAMVAVKADSLSRGHTQSILYSGDEGSTWKEYQFTDHSIVVDGVLNEPGITTTVISIYGHDPEKGSWTIVKLDFKDISRLCGDDDYEEWTPADEMSTAGCLLGQKVTFKRRKASAQCINGRSYKQAISTSTCKCEGDDYECDFGYKQKKDSEMECEKELWFDPHNPPWDCPEDTKYNVSSGHRRVPASRCEGGEDKYKPTEATCPISAPQGLHVFSSQHQVAAVGKVTFHITQEKGSKKSTKYTWNCGTGNSNYSATGYADHKDFSCTFNKPGKYTVTVMAKNAKTKHPVIATTRILIEEAVEDVEVTEPHGAQVGVPVIFHLAAVVMDQGDEAGVGYVHHVWMFGDEDLDQKPLLTYDSDVEHTFSSAGNYTCSVQTINAVSNTYREFTVVVYGTLTTVQMTFSSNLMRSIVHSVEWRDLLTVALRDYLARELGVEHTRLEVVMLDTFPLTADVSVLPRQQTSTTDDSIPPLVESLLGKNRPEAMSFDLDPATFGPDQSLKVISATVLQSGGAKKRNYTAVYVCVPILMLAVFVTVLIGLHYRRKFRTLRTSRYSVLHSRSSSSAGSAQGPDGVLEDDDDDDPLLEPELQPSRLAMTPPTDDDDPLGG